MKKVVITSLLIGIFISLYFYFNYKNNLNNELPSNNENIYFLQIGAYKNYDNIIKLTKSLPSYVIEKEDNLYYVYVGITGIENNIEKLEKYYIDSGNKIYLKTKIINNKDFLKKLETYDYIISSTSNQETINTINKESLKNYNNIIIN